MLTREDDVDAHALRRQGWTISAIARHLGHDRKTIRAYLSGGRVAGERKPSAADPLEPFVAYLRQRLADDPHVWASALFDEAVRLGFDRSYPTFTKGLRAHALRPHCEPCSASKGREHAVIEHPPGREIQWDWVELPDPPAHWELGSAHAHLLVGALPSSGQWRGVLADAEDHAHLVDALHQVSARLGGVPGRWRFDRMATVASPATGRVTATFAAVAKHYGVGVDLCPPRHGNRKGTVEKANHSAAQRWWRTLPDALTVAHAQASLDAFCAATADRRPRRRDGQPTTVGALAAAERALLGPLPPPFPATVTARRVVTAQALVAFRGNLYSVPPGLAGQTLTVTHRLGAQTLTVATASGTVLAVHRREPDGAGVMVRDAVHVTALERRVLAAFDTARPCHRKARRPPSAAALAEAEAAQRSASSEAAGDRPGRQEREVVVDLNVWAAAAAARPGRQVAP
jgi:transposase